MRWTFSASISTLVLSASLAAAQTPTGAKKPKIPAPPPPPPAPVEPAPMMHHNPPSTHMSGDGLDLSEGRYGFSFGFPDGNSPMGAGYVGAKYFTAPNTAVGAYLLLGGDSAAETSSFGLAGKYMSYFAQKDRLHLYGFGQLSLGKNGGAANKGKDDTLFGLAGGLGLEFVLLKDFSVSGEGGFGFNTLPDGKSAYATGTGKLAVNFYY
ncbi:MAG TPA: hypothetical protein VFO10_04935 [Oligoflexus sp.]|uniref:hypothetical protein n=1 Tax=Oligoflexus sp. TaxID=1971216 RepID=UPI002D7EE826|nr:hypothetical protein [Oligoflexus sp.]HET9236569.1 hypothetical protein [Oligoflexus sp.]